MKKSQILALMLMLFAFPNRKCIKVRQRTARHPFVHYSALILCTFALFRRGNLYFFMFHFFYVALVSCCIFLILRHFYVALFCVVIFSCCTFFFMLHSFYVLLYSMLHFYTLQCFRVTFFSCCTLSMLQFFPVALCSWLLFNR